jgi:hypothetical protein
LIWDRHGIVLSLRQAEVLVALPVLLTVFILLAGSASNLNEQWVPTTVTGLATVAGILTAFVGFWIVHLYSQETAFDNKLFLFKRMVSMLSILFGGLIFVIIGLSLMAVSVKGLGASFVFSVIGITIIVLVAVDVLLLLNFTDLAPKKPAQNSPT